MADLNIQSCRLFHTFEDTSSEYKLQKIKYDESEFEKLVSTWYDDLNEKLTCVGFIGDRTHVSIACQHFLELIPEQTQNLENLLKEQISLVSECLFAYRKANKIAFIYCCNNIVFQEGPLSPNVLAIDYVRYIIDMCEKILVFPPMDLHWNTNITNPFQDSANTYVQLQERNVRPNETISIVQLNTNQKLEPTTNILVQCSSSCRPYLQLCQDHNRHFVTYHFHEETDHKVKTVKVSTRDLSHDCFRSTEMSINYEEATKYLMTKWPTKHLFFASVQHRAMATFKHFLRDNKQEEFEQFLSNLSLRYKTIIDAKSLDTNKSFVNKLIQLCREHSCVTSTMDESFFASMVSKGKSILGFGDKSLPVPDPNSDFSKRFKKCSESCTSLDTLLKNLNRNCSSADQISELINTLNKFGTPEIFVYSIHWISVDDVRRKIKDLWREHNQRDLLHVYDDQCKDAREVFANELHQWLQLNTCDYDEIHRSEMKLNFWDFNPIMDVEGNIRDFKFMKKPLEMTYRLQMTTNEDIKDIRCSQIIFVNDKIGFINIANHPPGRATLFYFNQTDSTYSQIELEQKLASSDARILIDGNSGVYFIYDNVKQCAERGKLNEHTMRLQSASTVSNLYGNAIDGNDATDVKLQHIVTMCFLHGSDSMLLLDKQFNLIEYRYLSGTMKLVHKRINEDTHIKKVPLQSIDGLLYTHVTAAPNGKCILLQCTKSIDIYDLTWTMIGTIPIINIKQFVGYKVFIDQMNTYIAKIEKQTSDHQHICEVYLLRGLSASRTLDIEKVCVKNQVGFPFLDIFYLTQRKFGPPSESIGCPRKSSIIFFRPENFILQEEKLDSYFTQLYTINMQLQIESLNDPDYQNIFRRLPTIKVSDFRRIVKTRVPIHIATIEESNLFPLKDGRNITDEMAAWRNSKENKSSLVQCISELIRIGPYETLLKNCNQPIKVIAIVGRQSGGKSYLLNRLTGTRFNVAATRCTDGIWMSVAFVQTQPIVVLDCEGLFSTRRNDLEEIKLCLTFSALTDLLLLNQDLSFNRYLTQLFSNFSKSCDRMKGSNLFKGFLMMVIRDVSTQDVDGAYVELINNIRQQGANSKTAYLQKLFGGKIRGQCLHHFENRVFATEIDQMRQLILDLPYRWTNGTEFLDSLKLTLAQVHTDDDTLMDVHRLKMTFNRLEREAQKMLIEGGSLFASSEKLTLTLENVTQEGTSEIVINQEIINFMKYIYVESASDQTRDEEDLSRTSLLFHGMLSEHFQCDYHEQYHNIWLRNLNNLLKNVLDHRVELILKYVHDQLPNEPSMFAEILDFESSLKVKLDHLKLSSQLCIRTCRHCQRLCSKLLNHRDDCNCETDHLCKMKCQLCTEMMSNLCCDLYGHDGKHRCNEGHVCGKRCTMTNDCKMFCTLDIQHENDDEHDCNNRHYCGEKCSEYPACDKTCALDIKIVHQEHLCNENVCPHTCSVSDCRRRCTIPLHSHQRWINEGTTTTTSDSIPNFHVCSSNHTCFHQCEQQGVCAIGYNIVEKEWKNELNTFPYKFYEPVPSRSKCVLSIPLNANTHSNEIHDCKIDHRCGSQCPECRSFCQLPHGHTDPYHSTNTHRNKECNVFVSRRNDDQPVIVKNEGKCREYKAGESCKPEVCSESCERKGRAHFHLKLCPGGENCAANLYPYVKHSNDHWYPFMDNEYDLWLCEAYWHSLGWNVPYNDDIRAIINKCSFVCLNAIHGDYDQSFCIKDAWHTGEHTFDCTHETFDKLDIVFCCDTTGSMNSYINESKQTIRRIMEASNSIKDVKFRFVAYRDHPPEDETYITQSNSENLTSATNIIRFIETLDAAGGGDEPEAVLDGLHDAVMNTMWRETGTLKYIIHIADSPPHGRIYSGGDGDHWPDGCPCGKTIETISRRLNEKHIRYKLMKIGSFPNAMTAIFRHLITYFEESDLDGALDLSTKFLGILSRDLQVEEIDVIVD